MTDDDDGGMQWNAETELERAEYWGRKDVEALEAHRKWKEQFFNNVEVSHAEDR